MLPFSSPALLARFILSVCFSQTITMSSAQPSLPSPAPTPIAMAGVLWNVPTSLLNAAGCTPCAGYPVSYSSTSRAGMSCAGPFLFVGARYTGSTCMAVGAVDTVAVVTGTTVTNVPRFSNGVYWYYTPGTSTGFSKDPTVNQNSCDVASALPDARLCWHWASSGYRAGQCTTYTNINKEVWNCPSMPTSLTNFSASTTLTCAMNTCPCDPGQSNTGVCTPCAAGSYLPGWNFPTTTCLACPIGQFSGTTGSSSCTPCAPGSYADGTGSRNCTPCAPGSYADGTGSRSCTPCAPGSYADGTGSSSCTPCAPGRFADGTGSTSCTSCAVGKAAGGTGSSACTACPLGSFATLPGLATCTSCGANFSTISEGSSSAEACLPASLCLLRPENCLQPSLALSQPILLPTGATALVAPTVNSLLTSFSLLSAPAALRFPAPPSSGESVSVQCTTSNASLLSVSLASPPPTFLSPTPCTAVSPSSLCVTLKPPYGTAPLIIPLMLTSTSPFSNTASPGTLQCTAFSSHQLFFSSTSPSSPRYSLSTSLSAPLLSLPASPPRLSAIMCESTLTPGYFRSLGGTGAQEAFILPSFASDCSPTTFATRNLSQSYGSLSTCLSAQRAAEALAAQLEAAPFSVPFFSSTLSGKSTVLLFSPSNAPFPANLTVSLGGLPCTTQWASPNRTVLAIITPTLPALCTSAASVPTSTSGDCGVATLLLTVGATQNNPLQALVGAIQAQSQSLPIPLPGAYPPLVPQSSPLSRDQIAFAATLSIQTDLLSLLAASSTMSRPSQGIRIVARCTDPTFASPETCSLVNKNPALICPWGAGDDCKPCPAGAQCPGGYVLHPLPGFWAPSTASAPSELIRCPEPGSSLRCPGFSALLASPTGIQLCGTGYRGDQCLSCAPSYYSLASTCIPCPSNLLLSALVAVGAFAAGLMALGCGMLYAAHSVRRKWGGGLQDSAEAVGRLVVYIMLAAMSASSMFSVVQGLVPPDLAALFTILTALQFKGVSLPPACFSTLPFQAFWAALGAILGLAFVSASALACMRSKSPLPWPLSTFPTAATTLFLAITALNLGYGALVGVIGSAISCTPPRPITLRAYLSMASDGTAFASSHLAATAPPYPTLLTAMANPASAASLNVTSALLDSMLPVSVLANDPFQACQEAAHAPVYILGWLLVPCFILGYPALLAYAQCRTGRSCCVLHSACARRAPLTGAGKEPPPPLLNALAEAASDPTMVPTLAIFGPFNQALVAFLAASAGFSSLTTTLAPFAAIQGCASAAALSLALVTAYARPYRGAEVWKTHVSTALLLLTALTGAASVVMLWVVQGAAVGKGTAASLCISLISLAIAMVLLILFSWWRSLLKGDPQWKAKQAAARATRTAAFQAQQAHLASVGGGERKALAIPIPALRLPDWAKELLGMDEDVDVEARDRAASAVVHTPQLPSESEDGQEDAGAEVTFNPIHAASEQLAGEQPALLPGWQRRTDPATRTVFYSDEKGRVCLEPPLLEQAEGVDPLEHFECVDGERFYWSDGRRIAKGRRNARLLAPGWRRCVLASGVVRFLHTDGRLVVRPDYVH